MCHEREMTAIELARLQNDDTLKDQPFINARLQEYYEKKRKYKLADLQNKIDELNLDIEHLNIEITCAELDENYRIRERFMAKLKAEGKPCPNHLI